MYCMFPCLHRATPLGISWSSELLVLVIGLSPVGLATGATLDRAFGVATASGWTEVARAKQFDLGMRICMSCGGLADSETGAGGPAAHRTRSIWY